MAVQVNRLRNFVSSIHRGTERDYLARVNAFPKEKAAEIAKRFDFDYWDGDRNVGYGGFHYDGRWRAVADQMVEAYGLKPGQKVLDVGCGKGFLLYDLTQAVPGLEVYGLDISQYAIENAKEEVKDSLIVGDAKDLPYEDKQFDLVISINTLHNLPCGDFYQAMKEIVRVGREHQYLCVESYRNEAEKVNLLYWQLTCEMFCSPDEWMWWFKHVGYEGDYEFIYFE